MTPIVIGLADGLELRRRRAPGPVRAGDALFERVGGADKAATLRASGGGQAEVRVLQVMLQHGIHARPAALLAQRIRAVSAQVTIEAHGKRADARSVVSIMSLGVRYRDSISVQATGTGALAAIEAVTAGLEEAVRGEESAGPSRAQPAPQLEGPQATPAEKDAGGI